MPKSAFLPKNQRYTPLHFSNKYGIIQGFHFEGKITILHIKRVILKNKKQK